MSRERLKQLDSADPTPAVLTEAAEIAAGATIAGDIEAAALARAIEAKQARFLGRHQHAVVAGAELIELWPALRARPVPEKDEDGLRRRVVWGMKYVAGSAMDLPEVPLATTDAVLAVLAEMLDHYNYEKPALWQLQARRAFIAGDDDELRALVRKIGPTATVYHHVFQCGDCPGCVFNQFAEWLGPGASGEEVEEMLAPILGKRPFPPEPERWASVLRMLYGPAGACENASRSAPVHLARAYVRSGRLAEALREADRAVALAEGTEAERRQRAAVARTAVAVALGQTEAARALARELVDRASALEDAYERLDSLLVAHAALADPALVPEALALAERLDARVERKRHVAATRAALGLA